MDNLYYTMPSVSVPFINLCNLPQAILCTAARMATRPYRDDTDPGYWLECSEGFTIPASSYAEIPTGVRIHFPTSDGIFAQILACSGSASAVATLVFLPRVVISAADSKSPLAACVFNPSLRTVRLERGDRLAQIVFTRSFTPLLKRAPCLPVVR